MAQQASVQQWRRFGVLIAALGIVFAVVALTTGGGGKDTGDTTSGAGSDGSVAATPSTGKPTTTKAPPTTTTTTRPPYNGFVDPASYQEPYPKSTVEGLITFRGNPTRSYYGKGPVPKAPKILWSYPRSGGMCGVSSDETGPLTWCGTGWNGQPSVWERNGKTWVAFGAYDYGIHFLDYNDGSEILPTLKTGDLAKGTVTVDPDGFPLLYHGSRDNNLRVVALDRAEPTVLWKLNAKDVSPTLWNDDWDGSPLVVDDYLFEGGENSQIHIVKLNRAYGPDGKVTVNPQLVWHAPGWDDELLNALGDKMVSIENSVAISGNTLYFANSGGLVQGWDIGGLKEGRMPTRVFRFWTGDDTDSTITIDDQGFLYVGSEFKRQTARGKALGQIMKLDPRKPIDPVVWAIKEEGPGKQGVWGTMGHANGMLYVDTNAGHVYGIERDTGKVVWTKNLPGPTWQSPVIVDSVLVLGDCSGVLHGYDVSNPAVDPPELWSIKVEGCIESTPAVWKGRIFVGARGGKFYAIGDQ